MAGPGLTDPGTRREGDPSPDVKALLEAIQDAMGLPWLPFPWKAHARRPAVLKLFWSLLSDVTGSEVFLRESLAIAGSVHIGVSSWFHPSGDVSLPVSGSEDVTLAHPSWERLDPETRRAAGELRAAWSIPQVSVDILSLARWPGFPRRAVTDLKAVRMRPEYRTWRRRITDMGEDALERLRPRVSLPETELRESLRMAQARPSGADHLKDQVPYFAVILPGLILDNALLRMAAAAWMPAEEAVRGSP